MDPAQVTKVIGEDFTAESPRMEECLKRKEPMEKTGMNTCTLGRRAKADVEDISDGCGKPQLMARAPSGTLCLRCCVPGHMEVPSSQRTPREILFYF